MGRGIVRGSSSFLFFGEEYGYGVPDWNYDENEFTVGARVSPGEANFPATNPEFTHITISDSTVSGFAAGGGDWIVVYSGSLDIPAGGTNRPGEADNDGIDIIQVFKTKTGSGARSDSNQYGYNSANKTLTLDEDTLPRFAIRKGDKIRKLDGSTDAARFRTGRIHAASGMVSVALSVEIGEIPDESLAFAASGGSRIRGKSRRGGITGDGGNFVVQPGTAGYGALLRHAIGDKVYYNTLPGTPTSSGASDDLDGDVTAAEPSDTTSTIDLNSASGFTNGDIIRVGPNADEDYDFVVISAISTNELTVSPLRFNHADGEEVVEVDGTQINLAAGYSAGATSIVVDSITGLSSGDTIRIGNGDSAEIVELSEDPSSNTLTFANEPLRYAHSDNEVVFKVDRDEPIPHELRKGDLPCSLTLYQWSDDLESCWVIPGCKIGSYDLSAANEESTIKSTFNTIVRSAQLLESLPFDKPEAKPHAPYSNFELTLNKGLDRLVGLNSVTINGDNEITPLKSINAVGTYGSAAEGTGRWSTDFNYQLRNTTRFKETVEGTEADWSVGITYDIGTGDDAGAGLDFEFPGSTLTGNILPNIEDSGASSADGTLLTGQHDTKNTNVVCVVTSNEGRI